MTTLDEAEIRALLGATDITDVEKLEVFAQIDSTNTYLRDSTPPEKGAFRVALADHQIAGRGRGENRWVSAPGRSLCLSLAYTFRYTPENLPALTLALGVGAVDALLDFGIDSVRLKWPNDLLVEDAKLAGILAETQTRRDGAVVVAGIGLNVQLPVRLEDNLPSARAFRAVDLHSLHRDPPSRELLAVALIVAWRRTILEYEAGGFGRFVQRYSELDWLRGMSVVVAAAETRVTGVAAGVSADGALLVDTGEGTVPVISGSILSLAAV